MPIDANIALGARAPQTDNTLNFLLQIMQMQQLGQRNKLMESQISHEAELRPYQIQEMQAKIANIPAQERLRMAQEEALQRKADDEFKQNQARNLLAEELKKPTEEQARQQLIQAEARGEPVNIVARSPNLLASLAAQAHPASIDTIMKGMTTAPGRPTVVGPGAHLFRQGENTPSFSAPFAPRAEPAPVIRVVPDADGNFTYRNMRDPSSPLAAAPPPRNEAAPTIKDIIDPRNPSQMIAVDARIFDLEAYKKGSNAGVLGVAGREPTAAKREEKEGQGRDHLESELGKMREYYNTLNDAKAIPSSDRPGVFNVLPSIQASGVGQSMGRVFGTKEQDARNNIASARLRLLSAIKNATGMSAQQLNSNMELQTWLKALTDPTRTYESNMEILDSLENTFLKRRKSDSGPALPSQSDIEAEIARRQRR